MPERRSRLAALDALLIPPYFILIPLLLVAALLRFHDLGFQSLWFDELMTWQRARAATPGGVIAGARADVWPPGYPLWMWGWMRVAGQSEWAMRFPAALAGVASIAGVYTLGRRLFRDRWAGALAAAIMATLQIALYYSQEARPYSALIFYAITSTTFWLRLTQREEWQGRSMQFEVGGYLLTALIMAYWNYYGLVLIALHGLGAGISILIRRKNLLPWAGIGAGLLLGYAPWIGATLADLQAGLNFGIPLDTYSAELLAWFRFMLNLQHNYVLGAMALVALALIWQGWKRRADGLGWIMPWVIGLAWLLLPFTITYIRSATADYSLLVHRYLLISLPAACLLIGAALAHLPLPRVGSAALAAAIMVLLLWNLMTYWHYYGWVTKAQFREAAAEVMANAPDDALIIGYTGYGDTATHFDYYFQQAGSPLRVGLEAGAAADLPAVQAALDAHPGASVWLLAAPNPPDAALLDYLGPPATTFEGYSAWAWGWER